MFAAVESVKLRDELIGRLDAGRMDAKLQLPTNPKYLEGILAKAGAQRAHLVLPGSWRPDVPWWEHVNAHRESLAAAFQSSVNRASRASRGPKSKNPVALGSNEVIREQVPNISLYSHL